jgi:hypothetical protein
MCLVRFSAATSASLTQICRSFPHCIQRVSRLEHDRSLSDSVKSSFICRLACILTAVFVLPCFSIPLLARNWFAPVPSYDIQSILKLWNFWTSGRRQYISPIRRCPPATLRDVVTQRAPYIGLLLLSVVEECKHVPWVLIACPRGCC